MKDTKEVSIAASVAGDMMLSFSVAELPLELSAEEAERLRALHPQPLAVSDAGTWEFCGLELDILETRVMIWDNILDI